MAIEIDIRIIGDTTPMVIDELRVFAAHLHSGLGVGMQATSAPDTPEPATPEPPPGTKANGADTPAKTARGGKKATAVSAGAELKAQLDRAAIIDGLTKIYSKGDEDVRLAITKFRDGQGADRLRDLKDDALPAAAALLIELKTAADQPSV